MTCTRSLEARKALVATALIPAAMAFSGCSKSGGHDSNIRGYTEISQNIAKISQDLHSINADNRTIIEDSNEAGRKTELLIASLKTLQAGITFNALDEIGSCPMDVPNYYNAIGNMASYIAVTQHSQEIKAQLGVHPPADVLVSTIGVVAPEGDASSFYVKASCVFANNCEKPAAFLGPLAIDYSEIPWITNKSNPVPDYAQPYQKEDCTVRSGTYLAVK